ncbi:PepSY domain-containing protein [Methylophaga sp.]|uniref:PepSY-associated TM helix domain-containing protein n=1 Tax=Methylophaga sp. TaxID=2024840 RepID=UPI0027270D70|nr:PepSY-associated TM helix domain-containing protein [Methylophaga sp.]MDO8826207.1 PepSY-associated TM helix domain-containing protein [Methylophaga sp.]
MFSNFRQAMAWLHTWFGLTLGFILMVVFFFGSLSVFDREIDRWSIPESRFEPQVMPSFDEMLLPILRSVEPSELDYNTNMPLLHDLSQGPMTPRTELPADEFWAYTTHRDPVLIMGAGFLVPQPIDPAGHNHIHGNITIDPRNGKAFPDDQLKIGSRFFYPMHYSLNWNWNRIGIYIVGIAAFIMMAALVSGVIIHRKRFREFFTFRPDKQTQRSVLDLHNLTGMVALPFHFFFTFTGLVIFASFFYFPVTHTQLEPLHDYHEILEAHETGLPHDRAGVPIQMASVDAMVAQAKQRWAEKDMPGEVGFLKITHVDDANSFVSIYRAGSDRVALVGEGMHFSATTGELIREEPPRSAISEINEFLTGLHLQHFEHWLLRWLYVFGGLVGAICIATGFIFFVEKRKRQHTQQGSSGSQIVDALAVTTVTGMLVATVSMLVANRLLPAEMVGKGYWEQVAFWGSWVVMLLHAFWRSTAVRHMRISPAWREQSILFAVLAVAAVILNWVTTGDHLLKTAFHYWPVAGVDLSLLVSSGIAIYAARYLKQRENVAVSKAIAFSAQKLEASRG